MLALRVPVNPLSRWKSFQTIMSKCPVCQSRLPCPQANRHPVNIFGPPCSRLGRNPSEYSHETADAVSLRSGTASLLSHQNSGHNAENTSLSRKMRRASSRWQRMQGYRVGVSLAIGTTGIVFAINLALTIWASKTFGVSGGFGTIQRGNCDQTKKLSLWLHFAINVLSTALLGASNYCMQCLSSPTRQDIDKAHAQNIWLDIGIPSVRNLRRIEWKKIILWWLLGISSLPLHLMYNSAVFDTLSTHQYNAYVVTKDFLSGAPYNISIEGEAPADAKTRLDKLRDSISPNSDNPLERLDPKNCILTYGGLYPKNKDVLLVSNTINATNSFLLGQKNSWGSTWLFCGFRQEFYQLTCNVKDAANHAEDWSVSSDLSVHSYWHVVSPYVVSNLQKYPIDYCLSQTTAEKCALQFSLPIMLIVIICNLIKITCMILIMLMKGPQPLVTVGDAIASFLVEPDPATKNKCLADKYFFRRNDWQARKMTWKFERRWWFHAASKTRWLACNIL